MRMGGLLNDIKKHPNSVNIMTDLHINNMDIYESSNSVQCEIDMATNRLEITHKQIERTLGMAQIPQPQDNPPSQS